MLFQGPEEHRCWSINPLNPNRLGRAIKGSKTPGYERVEDLRNRRQQYSPPRPRHIKQMDKTVAVEYRLKKRRISSQASPNKAPVTTSTVFQIKLPAVVNRRKGVTLIPAMPAGMEMRLRTMGTIRQKKTVLPS